MKQTNVYRLLIGILVMFAVIFFINGLASLLDGRNAHPSLLTSSMINGIVVLSAIVLHRKALSDGYLWIMLLVSVLILLSTVFLESQNF